MVAFVIKGQRLGRADDSSKPRRSIRSNGNQRVDRPLQDERRRRAVDTLGAFGAADVGGDHRAFDPGDRKSVVKGKSVPVRVDLGGRRLIKQKKLNIEKINKI